MVNPAPSSGRRKIHKMELSVHVPRAGTHLQGLVEHRPVGHQRMKLPLLAAGINRRRHFVYKRSIEMPTAKRRRQLFAVHATQARAQAAGDHVPRQGLRIPSKQRKHRYQTQSGHLCFTIGFHVGQKQIAKNNMGDLELRLQPAQGGSQPGLINRVAAVGGQPNRV